MESNKTLGKLFIAAIGWILVTMPFASWTEIGEEEYLTGFSWALIMIISLIYWAVIFQSKWMNNE